ncbi:parB-like partition protein [Sphingopyxis fribergensis]|uniref:ParB-like partition protein n=1 Tax=Sphingopyxis fribergensis TaxID=1515612 RepID=A0A0A7PKV5_9SPHN|nr:ParB N-terminal domain-containing protein [Sphingopyxis fribergensis]AJA09878.1 parB-like partition protein [Sphingopyxis fribergensis]
MTKEQPADAVQPAPVVPPRPQTVATNSLKANPHNPRVLFDEAPLQTLEASIRKVGVLVPLTVYQAAGSDIFTILDGQRRWICAQRIGLTEVPINQVTEPTLAQNIVTMFQIHKLRKDWELMPTALKLGVLIEQLEESREAALADLTGLDVAVVTRCKKLLSFEEEFQDRMLDPDPETRLNADLFIEMYPIITDRTVRSADWYNRAELIRALMDKYLNLKSGFRAVTDFRKIKSYLTAARKSGTETELLAKLRRFISDPDMMIQDLEVDEARIHTEAETLTRQISRLRSIITALDPEEFIAEEGLWEELEALLSDVKAKLAAGERRSN